MSRRSIAMKQQNRILRTARKQAAAREIPFSGYEYPRGTPQRRKQDLNRKRLQFILSLVFWNWFYQQQRKVTE